MAEQSRTKDDYYYILHRREERAKNRPLGCRTALQVDSDLEKEFLRETDSEEEEARRQRERGGVGRKHPAAAARNNPRRAYYAALAHAKELPRDKTRARTASPAVLRRRQLDSEPDYEPTPEFMKSWKKRHAAALRKNKVYQFMQATQSELGSQYEGSPEPQSPLLQVPVTPQTWPRKALGTHFNMAATPGKPDGDVVVPTPYSVHSIPGPTYPLTSTPCPPLSAHASITPVNHQPPMVDLRVRQQASAPPGLLHYDAAPPPPSTPTFLHPNPPHTPPVSQSMHLSPLEQAQEEMRRAADTTRLSLQDLLAQLQQERASLSLTSP
uniref:Uncharacterized protein n=1 Tax=Dunaliella tertiolecta TaxID=3047 RepID=A0A7S3QQL8_DUNTE|mmetsp:Transcript_24319/g.66489  ORF Transcript_24319/g.66489 Transcript_24319/m.66489 type:complete len:325 (+) Transcript_24319:235-1209(+)|eukprot:CAMPEP_0202347284 /NCGR_PEP_ID=MMETSP1126-20121109/5712_1 /ASSEMBLY_ACC=CAM_ASM_000457 /TAXON_ID=3047 /ORGANISM="Dunaliella tertiolecta, Strain CCMP1320" /LENGTH=324 /DNA_ID=CAMNT_0048938813 /DNA_START=111 /DNA_END=1085 /DNA_ORIENTATION=+